MRKDIKQNTLQVGRNNGVKLPEIQKIIQHYSERKLKIMNDKVVDLKEYKQLMSLE